MKGKTLLDMVFLLRESGYTDSEIFVNAVLLVQGQVCIEKDRIKDSGSTAEQMEQDVDTLDTMQSLLEQMIVMVGGEA